MSFVGALPARSAVPHLVVPAPVRWAGRVVLWALMLVCLAAVAAGVLLPRAAGGTPYTILTGSMEPNYPPGTLVVDKPVDTAHVGVGTIVTYQLVSGEAAVVTHRVVAVHTDMTGRTTYTTQGDANSVADEKPVQPAQIRGQFWYAVPYLGRANVLLTGHQRQIGVYGVAGGLALYAGAMFAGALRGRRRGKSPARARHAAR